MHQRSQTLFLYLLAMIQHRPDLRPQDVPETLRLLSFRFRTALAGMIDSLAVRTEGSDTSSQPALRQALAEFERETNLQLHILTDSEIRGQISARLSLYQKIYETVTELAITCEGASRRPSTDR